MADDKVGFKDVLDVGLSTEVVPPRYGCPTCGVETKHVGVLGWRICTDCDKRVYVGMTEVEHKGLLDELAAAKSRITQLTLMYKNTDAELTKALRVLRDRGIL